MHDKLSTSRVKPFMEALGQDYDLALKYMEHIVQGFVPPEDLKERFQHNRDVFENLESILDLSRVRGIEGRVNCPTCKVPLDVRDYFLSAGGDVNIYTEFDKCEFCGYTRIGVPTWTTDY